MAGASSKGPCELVADLGTSFLTVEMEGCRCVVGILHASHVRKVPDQKVLATCHTKQVCFANIARALDKAAKISPGCSTLKQAFQ